MRILICNERFLFRFGVDRVLLLLGMYWKKDGHEIIMMGSKIDPLVVEKCCERFIQIPESADYPNWNTYTRNYIEEHWDEWFDENNKPDVAFIAGWPFYESIDILRRRCGVAIFHDYGAVPLDGMDEGQKYIQNILRKLRKENLKHASKIVAISKFLEITQSHLDGGENVDVSSVLLGVDHLSLDLWNKNDLNVIPNDVIDKIKQYKSEGYKIIFQTGRWENENYKNSAASIELIKALKENNLKAKILLLANADDIRDVPSDIRDNYVPMGFIDDNTMREVMEISDLGISPTLWEGFDLPLGEMQYLYRPMFVLDIGAHPEVVADSYFLCSDMKELIEKTISFFAYGLPFSSDEFIAICDSYKKKLTWEHTASDIMRQIEDSIKHSTTVFIDVTNACHDTANSGVMRVTRKIAHHLQKRVHTIFVMWDDSIGKYVFPYAKEVELLCSYGGPDSKKIEYKSVDGQARTILDDVLQKLDSTKMVHLFTETVNSAILKKATDYFHQRHIPVAAVFYDAIAVYRPELCARDVSENHKKYMMELSSCEVVMPIASHNGNDLQRYWIENHIEPTDIRCVELVAQMDSAERNTNMVTSISEEIRILFVSTLEPRKNHKGLLQAIEQLFATHEELREKVTLHLVGNRYAGNDDIPNFVEDLCNRYKNVQWLGVVDDERLKREYSECTFTVYPSEIEGFGMPIIESLWFGKPCLCSDAGSIGELGSYGGCATTNVLSVNDMCDTLYRLCTDSAYYLKLQHEAISRHIRTWDVYADEICGVLIDVKYKNTGRLSGSFDIETTIKLREHFADNDSKRVIVVSNFYPPNFVGGAEIIAHHQAISMQKQNTARVVAITVDTSMKKPTGSILLDEVDGIFVVRISVEPAAFDSNGINFYSNTFNKIFDELCYIVKPDIVHCHNIIGTSLGVVSIAKNHHAKVWVTLHDNWGFCYKNTMLDNKGNLCKSVFDCRECKSVFVTDSISIPIGVRQDFFRRVFEDIDAYISPSSYLANTYLRAGFDFHKMHVIWNGIDVDRFDRVVKKPSDKIRISTVAYFGKHKGIDILLEAIGMLRRNDIVVNLVGAGEEEGAYRQLIEQFGITSQVVFWGKIDNSEIEKVYQETDIYILPSIWPENQPVTITESMACGIPVIASDLGGSKELVDDGVTGYLFQAGNKEALVDKISRFLDDKAMIESMGMAGKKKIQSYSYQKQVMELNKIYDEIIHTKQSYLKSRDMIAINGYRMPIGIKEYTDYDVLHWDWIDKTRIAQIKALVILDDERIEDRYIKLLQEHMTPIYANASIYNLYKNDGLNITLCESELEILRYISKI